MNHPDDIGCALDPVPGLSRSGRCCSDWQLDRHLLGELSRADATALRQHLLDSEACRRRLDELDSARAAFVAADRPRPAHVLASRSAIARRRRQRWVAFASTATLAVACLALVALFAPADRRELGTRTKGSSGVLTVTVQTGDEVRIALPGERVAPGDVLMFTLRSPTSAHVAVLGRDASRAVTAYFPAGPTAQRVDAREEIEIDQAIELDAVLGDETVLAFFCDTAVPIARLTAAVREAGTALPDVPGCGADRIVLDKRGGR